MWNTLWNRVQFIGILMHLFIAMFVVVGEHGMELILLFYTGQKQICQILQKKNLQII